VSRNAQIEFGHNLNPHLNQRNERIKIRITNPWLHHALFFGGADYKTERFVTVLEIPPVDSPKTAVKMAIYSGLKKGRK
jgi:hypothetical protein